MAEGLLEHRTNITVLRLQQCRIETISLCSLVEVPATTLKDVVLRGIASEPGCLDTIMGKIEKLSLENAEVSDFLSYDDGQGRYEQQWLYPPSDFGSLGNPRYRRSIATGTKRIALYQLSPTMFYAVGKLALAEAFVKLRGAKRGAWLIIGADLLVVYAARRDCQRY